MSIVVPNTSKIFTLQTLLNATLTLKLYSNNLTPSSTTTLASLTEVSGGGYASLALQFSKWTITGGSPGRADYQDKHVFQFTGATNSPGTIYGYYVVDSLGNLRWVERFPTAALPFVPVNGSIIKVRPRFSAGSIYSD